LAPALSALSTALTARRVAAALATTALTACRVATLAATALATAEPALAAALTTLTAATPAHGLRHQLRHLRIELVSFLARGVKQLLSEVGQLLPVRGGQARGGPALAARLSPASATRLRPALSGLTTLTRLLGPHCSQ
jgi:hypothetical protein